jgi:hypothetical protein
LIFFTACFGLDFHTLAPLLNLAHPDFAVDVAFFLADFCICETARSPATTVFAAFFGSDATDLTAPLTAL